jgi:hypothetical protein
MVDELCEPFGICDDLDGRLLVNQAIEGPPLAFELGEVSFGSFTANGAAARPYVDLKVEQRWIPEEACYGPVRSIFSLAPGETVELVMSVDQQTSLVETVSDHLPNVRDPGLLADFAGIAGTASARPRPTADAAEAKKLRDEAQRIIELQNRYVGRYGSLWETIADPFGIHKVIARVPGAPPSPSDVANGLVDVVKGALAGDRSPAADAIASTANAASAAGAASVARHTRDTTTTKTTTISTHQSLTRTFANPYRDRSMQLRFIPVFRRFEVVTEVKQPEVGVAVQTGGGDVGDRGTSLEQALAAGADSPRAAHVLRPVVRMFSQIEGGSGGVPALAWSQASARGDSLLVPVHDPTSFGHSIGLDDDGQSALEDTFRGIADLVAGVERERREVSLFMGTHIEAVAGDCVLDDLPPIEAPSG